MNTEATSNNVQWYVYTAALQESQSEARKMGPITHPQLKVAIQNGIFQPTDYYWRDGFDDWVTGDQVPDLERFFTVQQKLVNQNLEPLRPPSVGGRETDSTEVTAGESLDDEENLPEFQVAPHMFGSWVNYPDRWLREYAEDSTPGEPS